MNIIKFINENTTLMFLGIVFSVVAVLSYLGKKASEDDEEDDDDENFYFI